MTALRNFRIPLLAISMAIALNACTPFYQNSDIKRTPALTLSGHKDIDSTTQNNKNSSAQNTTSQNNKNSPQKTVEYTLKNGLRVVLKQDKRTPVVMTQIWYDVGSSDEIMGKGGLAHFLEHMMFKDAKGLTSDEYNRIISHFGGEKNAFTSFDYTAYYEMLPANQYPVALQIEANRMDNLILKESEVATEKQVIQEERRQRIESNPMAKAFEAFNAVALSDTQKGRPVIGSMKEIENLDYHDLAHWYDVWYSPNNAVLVMVGDFEIETAKSWIDKYFSPLEPKDLPPRPNLRQKSHRGYNLQTSHIDGIEVPSLIMAYNVPSALTATGDDAYALDLLSSVLDGGLSARFETSLVRHQNLLNSVSVRYSLFDKGDGLFTITATPRDGVSLETAEAAIEAEINKALTGDIHKDELERSQTSLITGLVFGNDSIADQAEILGSLNSLRLPSDTYDKLPARLSTINGETIQAVGKKYLSRDNLTVMYIYPAKP